jgi:hypothetical protein
VAALDEGQDRLADLSLGVEPSAVEQRTLEGAAERLGRGVVAGIADRAGEGLSPASSHLKPKATDMNWLTWSE